MPAPPLDAFERTRYRDLKGEFRLLHGRDPNIEECATLHFEARKQGAHQRQDKTCRGCAEPITDVKHTQLAYAKHARKGDLVHDGGACLAQLKRRKLITRVAPAGESSAETPRTDA